MAAPTAKQFPNSQGPHCGFRLKNPNTDPARGEKVEVNRIRDRLSVPAPTWTYAVNKKP
jgi:hypothetical protein